MKLISVPNTFCTKGHETRQDNVSHDDIPVIIIHTELLRFHWSPNLNVLHLWDPWLGSEGSRVLNQDTPSWLFMSRHHDFSSSFLGFCYLSFLPASVICNQFTLPSHRKNTKELGLSIFCWDIQMLRNPNAIKF